MCDQQNLLLIVAINLKELKVNTQVVFTLTQKYVKGSCNYKYNQQWSGIKCEMEAFHTSSHFLIHQIHKECEVNIIL